MAIHRALTLGLAAALAAAGCGPQGSAEIRLAAEGEAETRRPAYVDSIFPIEEELRRFRATLTEEPTELRGGAASRDALVARFRTAVETGDTSALAEMLLTRAEFAYLYYPYTRFTTKPYELSPALYWFQIQNRTSRGIARLLRRYGSRPLGFVGYRCDGEPETVGENRVWSGCVVRWSPAPGETLEDRLFGSIVERDGRYKFVSYSNSL